ncbi:MAG TPA: SDR family NAD(P)-dependent oxidoreductase, partial [Acidimicrobiales bacterium]
TLRGIVDFLFEHEALLGGGADAAGGTGTDAAAAPADVPVSEAVPEPAAGEPEGIPSGANRFVVTLDDQPLGPTRDLTGLPVTVTGGSALARALVEELGRRGAAARLATGAAGAGNGNGNGNGKGAAQLVVLTDLVDGALGEGPVVEIPELYARIRPLLLETTSEILVVSPLGGGLGIDPPSPLRATGDDVPDALPVAAGVRGMVKTAALEYLDRRIGLVDLDPGEAAADLARAIADEVEQRYGAVEVAWRQGVRRGSRIGVRPDTPTGTELPLTPESVVLLTGGARGITARVAVALAERSGCAVELVGRSALPDGEEPPEIAACTDRAALRGALIKTGLREPRAIERECDRILAGREASATLAALRGAGSQVTYHQVDVRDAAALEAVVADVYARHGRLDAVVHGAGILDDHFIADKAPDAFERVFTTKVEGARTLLRAIRRAVGEGRERPRFVVFFGSTAGVCGNRGQADYAAANDALDAMAAANPDVADSIFALDWGPWSSEAGMVSDALAAIFQAGGMGLIQVADGTAVMFDEIAAAFGQGGTELLRPHQVTVARCAPELIAAAFAHASSGQGRS